MHRVSLFLLLNRLSVYSRSSEMDDENDLIAQRSVKLEKLRARGVAPFGAAFKTSGSIAQVREKFAEGETLRAAGRASPRNPTWAESHSVDLRDSTGHIPVYVHTKELGPEVIETLRCARCRGFHRCGRRMLHHQNQEPTLKVR